MARYIWTLIAGFVLGIYTVFQIVLRVKPLRKVSIDAFAKLFADWLYVPEVRRTPVYFDHQRRYSRPDFGRTVNQQSSRYRNSRDLPILLYMVETQEEASAIYKTMEDLVKEKGYFTVADFKTAVGRNSTFEDSKLGWTNVDDVLSYSKDGGDDFGYRIFTKKLAEAI